MSFKVSNILQFPQSTLQYLPQDEYDVGATRGLPLLGGVLSDTRYVWHAKGPCLEVRNTKTGTKVGAWTFGCILKDSNTKVVCVEEIERLNGRLSLLAVGIECTISGGLICVFDVFGSKVIRAIQIKEKITSLHVVDSGCEVLNLPGPLRNFDGIISVGTEGGNVYLVDICRQICDEALHATSVRDELCPCQIVILTLRDVPRIEYYKQKAVREGDHLAMHLNLVLNSVTQHFILKGQRGEDRIHVNREEVVTSALYYCPQLTSLLVGFNFGAYQLWDLTSLKLVYTSPVCEEHLSINHFALQEPADDPRAFCYIWVSYSNNELLQSGLPFAVMYSLCYESKDYHEGYGYLYQDFQSCSVRFQVELGQLGQHRNNLKAKGGSCIAIQPICKAPANKDIHSHDSTGDPLALCAVSWTVWFNQNDTQTYMLVFDLNQWYKDQMPDFTKWSDCSNYILRVSITDLILMAGRKGGPFLDIKIDKKSLRQFIGVQRLEEHFCPTALTFDVWGLRENDVALLHNEGLQKSLLSQIETSGPLCLIRPNDVYRQVMTLGLIPLFTDVSLNLSISTEMQREIILNVGLENQLLGWLCKSASEWANGSFSSAGCSLDFLIHWAFQRAVLLKTNCDNYCTPLFDHSQSRLDNNTSILLNSCTRQINNLCTFYSYVLNKLGSFISNPELVQEQHTSLKMVSVYFEVLQWLVNVGLLPECHPSTYPRSDNTERNSAPYPVTELTEYYNRKRAQLQLLTRETFISSDSLLFIDNLVTHKCGAEQLQKQWKEDGGSGLYPPPSLQSMLHTYLAEGADINHKHSLIIYVFLDLAMVLNQNSYSSIITHLIKFPVVFKVSSSVIKITHAFWQLDHGEYATAMEQLLDPVVLSDDLQPWHHAIAMRALFLQKQYNLALLYMQVRRPPITDEKDLLTAISLFIANNMLDEAFYFKNQHQNNNEERLLLHLFSECNKNESLHVLLYRNLNSNEEKAFFKYLKSVVDPSTGDLQVFYYLLRSRFVEAFDAHNNSKRKKPECQGLVGQRNASKTDQIIKIFKTLLPDVNRNIVDVIQRERTNLWKEVPRPAPLSVSVHNTNEQVQYKSTIIHAALVKAKQTFNDSLNNMKITDVLTEETPFLRTPKASQIGSRHIAPVISAHVIEINEDGEEMGPSPAKRLRLNPNSSTTSPLRNQSISIHSKMLTPIVKRKTSLQNDQSLHSNSSLNVCTPQSILKVRNLVRHSDVASDDTRINDILEDYEGLARIENSPRKSGLGLLPRKSLRGTPLRSHVQFDEAARFSSSFSDQSIKPSLNNTLLEDQSYDKSTSKDMVCSKNSSSSNTSDIFYSPNSSINEMSQETSLKELPAEQSNAQTQEMSLEAVPDGNKEEQLYENSHKVSSVLQSPRARRSYKRSLGEAPLIRSSPRLAKHSVATEQSDLDNKICNDINTLSENESPVISREESISEEDNLSKAGSPTIQQTPQILQKVRGRKSLTRQVLEHNTFSRVLTSPSVLDRAVSKETSISKSQKVVVTKRTLDTSEVTSIETKLDISDASYSEPSKPSSNRHSASNLVTKKRVLEASPGNASAIDCNICLDSPDLPESLKMSVSLLEFIKSRAEGSNNPETPEADSNKATASVQSPHTSISNSFMSDSDTSFDYNVCLDSPVLPDRLKLSESLLEFIKSRQNKTGNNDDNHTKTDIEESKLIKDQPEDNQNDLKITGDDKFMPELMDVYEDLSSGAEDIEEVLTASKQQSGESKIYEDLTVYSENAYNEFERNIFDIDSREQSIGDQFRDSIVQEEANISSSSTNPDTFYVTGAEKHLSEGQSKIDISVTNNEGSYLPADTGFIAKTQEVIEIGSSSEEESTKSDPSESSRSKSSLKSESDAEELNISYERNIHIEENSRSLLGSEFSPQQAEHFSESDEGVDQHQEEREGLIDYAEQSRSEGELEINEDDGSVDWINNDQQFDNENNEQVEPRVVEDNLKVEVAYIPEYGVEEHKLQDTMGDVEIIIEPKEVLAVAVEQVATEFIVTEDRMTEFIVADDVNVNIESLEAGEDTDDINKNESNKVETETFTSVSKSGEDVKQVAGAVLEQKIPEEIVSVDKIHRDTDKIDNKEKKQITSKESPGQTEKINSATITTMFTAVPHDKNVSSLKQDKVTIEQSTNTAAYTEEATKDIDEPSETGKIKHRRIYHPKHDTIKVISEDQTVSSVSSDTTEGDMSRQEIVVTAQIHSSSKKQTKSPSRKRATRRSSLNQRIDSDALDNMSNADMSIIKEMSVNLSRQDVLIDNLLNTTCQTPQKKKDSSHDNLDGSDDVCTPGRRTRRSLSATLTPTRSVKMRKSLQMDTKVDLDQPTTSKDTVKESAPSLRRTRSTSVDEVKTVARKRSLRSGSIDEKIQEHKPNIREKATSVSELPVISEHTGAHSKTSNTRSKSMIETYATARRLTRHQASLVKGIETPSNLTAQDGSTNLTAHDDSKRERGLDIDAIDPINLLDKEPFQGMPDPEEEKVYEQSSPSNSTASSFNKPAKRTSRSASMASDLSNTSTPKRRTRQSVGHSDSISPQSGVKTRSRKQSETSSITSEKSSPPTPPKRARKKDNSKEADDTISIVSVAGSSRSLRSRANSTSSVESDMSTSKKATRSRRIVSMRSDLPEIAEERNSEGGDSSQKTAPKKQSRMKSNM